MADAAASANQWDLIPRMTPFLDRHLVLPLLEFLEDKQVSLINVIFFYALVLTICEP